MPDATSSSLDAPFPWFRLLATALALALFIAAVSAVPIVGVAVHGVPVHRSVLDVHGVSDGSAIVLWKDPDHQWLSRYDANGERWRAQVPGEARHIVSEGSAIGVGRDFVVLQYIHPLRQSYELLAVELATGQARWTRFVESPSFSDVYPHRDLIGDRMYVANDDFLVATEAGWLRVDPATGGTLALDGDPWRSEIVAGSIHETFAWHRRGPHRIDRGVSCSFGGGTAYVDVWTDGDEDDAVLEVAVNGVARESLVIDAGYVNACAEYDGAIVLSSYVETNDRTSATRFHIVSDRGVTLRDIVVPGRADLFGWNRDRNALATQLPRFVVIESVEVNERRVALLDLEEGRVTRSTAGAASRIMRVGRWWMYTWWRWRDADAFVLVDSNTGATLAELAVSLGSDPKPHHVAGDYLWVFSRYQDDLSLGRIELATMRADVTWGSLWFAYARPDAAAAASKAK